MNRPGGSLGARVREARRKKDWTVKQLIEELKRLGVDSMSPAYMTRIEQYGEIPSAELICQLADALDLNMDQMLDIAVKAKVASVQENLESKYLEAAGLYRTQKERKTKD